MSTTGADEMSRVQFFILLMAEDSREVMQLAPPGSFQEMCGCGIQGPGLVVGVAVLGQIQSFETSPQQFYDHHEDLLNSVYSDIKGPVVLVFVQS